MVNLLPPLVLRLAPAIKMSAGQFFKLCGLNGDLRLERTNPFALPSRA